MKGKQVNVRLSDDVKKKLEDKAATVGMSVSEYVRYLITKDLKK